MLISRGKRKAKTDKGGGVTRSVIMPVFIIGIALFLSAAAALLVAMPGTATRAYTTVGEKQISDRYGVVSSNLAIEPATIAAEFQKMDEAGIQWVRTQFAWSDIEKTQGNWDYTNFDTIVNEAEHHEMKVLGILIGVPNWGHPLGSGNSRPPTPGDPVAQAAWLDYVERVCTRYSSASSYGRVDAWEVWNEPDSTASWGYTTVDPVAYFDLLKVTAQKIKQIDPDAKVVMAGVTNPSNPYDSNLPFPEQSYLYKCLSLLKADAEAAGDIDATAFHDNGNASWSIKRDYMNFVRSWLNTPLQLPGTSPLENYEIWVTECGVNHTTVIPPDETQAAGVLRVLLTYATEDVDPVTAVDEYADMVFYYSLKYDVCQMGLMTASLEPFGSYNYYKTLETVIGTAVGDDPAAAVFGTSNADPKNYCFVRPDGDLVIAAWIESGLYSSDVLTFTVQDPNYGNPFQVDLETGNRTALASPYFSRDAQGRVVVTQLPISHTPVIIELDSLQLPHLYSVTPNACDQAASITINDVSGSGFVGGTTVRLEMDATVFAATSVTFNSSTSLTCTFDLSTAAVGYYDVVVKNPDNQEARIVDALGVALPSSGCGTGTTTAAIIVFGMTMGLISVREVGRRRRGAGRAK